MGKPTEQIEIIARGVLLRGSRVLLCQNLKHGYYYLPGGHVEFAESAAEAVRREFVEETGLKVRVGSLALVSEGTFKAKKDRHHEINLTFHVEHGGAAKLLTRPKSREKGIGFEWVELAAVPEWDVRPTSAKAFLSALGHAEAGVEWVSEVE